VWKAMSAPGRAGQAVRRPDPSVPRSRSPCWPSSSPRSSHARETSRYVAGAATQSSTALDTIRWVTGGAPAIFIAICAAIMLAYPLTEQRFQEMVSEVALRRAGRTPDVGEEWTA
jgi:hypothetical protein